MEAQSGGGGGGGGGEVRKIHIIYFLGRKGRVKQPHLIEVHHLSNNGVRLCDVKRWLLELRGKDMPESFAWSYKRRYKTGYIWQDLLDEDLITPISDNEYVLKGSEIPSINLSSAVADDSVKLEEENSVKLEEEKTSVEKNQETLRISANASTLTKNNSKDANNPSTPASSTSSSQFSKTSKSYSSNVFRLLITCGGSLGTNESAIMINKKNSCYTPSKKPGVEKIVGYRNTAKICKEDKLGGSERVFRASWLQEQKPRPSARKSCDGLKSSSNNSKPVSAAYKPINGPNCSQCGKMFRPDKMHKHMKSCRGMKSLAKSATSASAYEPRKSSVSGYGYFLTNGNEFE